MQGLASVVIPVYNGERFLGEAIESVLAQTYEPVEVIVVDDASTDGSAAKAEGYDKTTVIRHSRNSGCSVARNIGFAHATGAYITTLDADDMMKPTRLEKQIAAIEQGAEFVLTNDEILVEDGAEVPEFFTARLAPISQGLDLADATSYLARRETIERIGPVDEELTYGEDVDYVLRAFELCKVVTLEEPLTIRRYHGANMTYDFERSRAGALMALKRRIERKKAAAARGERTPAGSSPPTAG